MGLQIGHLQARQCEFRIHDIQAGSKSGLVSLGLAAQRLVSKFTGLHKASKASLGMFHLAPAFFYEQVDIVERLFFHAGKRAVKRLRVAHLGASLTTLKQIPLHLGAHGPFRLQNGQVLGVEFLVGKQGHRRVVIGTGGTYSILTTLAFRTQLA